MVLSDTLTGKENEFKENLKPTRETDRPLKTTDVSAASSGNFGSKETSWSVRRGFGSPEEKFCLVGNRIAAAKGSSRIRLLFSVSLNHKKMQFY